MHFQKRIPILSQQVGLFVLYTLFIIPSPLSAAPLLRISAPSENQTVLGKDITISFVVGNLIMGAEGHIHLWLDNPGETASTAAIITTHFDYILENVSPGAHTLTLELVKPDHASFSPGVKETVRFTSILPQALSSSPTPSFLSPLLRIDEKVILGLLAIGIIIIGFFFLFFARRP